MNALPSFLPGFVGRIGEPRESVKKALENSDRPMSIEGRKSSDEALAAIKFDAPLLAGAARPGVGFTDARGRDFVSLNAIAEVSGIDASRIHRDFRPLHWGCPGDWTRAHGRTFYRVDHLLKLAREFAIGGEPEAVGPVGYWFLSLRRRPVLGGWSAKWEGSRS